ncbi:uncharacterized protein LOC143460308 [Clavelina lepadiformis]|uniref:uncharacterized protein LOC143460308 n=1 Tax=Clavelina lepadiformis TaxID=159417 RepID=UPI0040434C84
MFFFGSCKCKKTSHETDMTFCTLVLTLLLTTGFMTDVQAVTTFIIEPPYNPLVTGFNNVTVRALFPKPTESGDTCSWFYGGELDSFQFYSLGDCDLAPSGIYDSISCTNQTIAGTSHIITVLTTTQPLAPGNINFEVRCDIANNTGPISTTVQGEYLVFV